MRHYKKNSQTKEFHPRLLVEKPMSYLEEGVGFLYFISNPDKKIKIAGLSSREFRLVQCLFSPQNFLSADYNPVSQTHERIFSSIATSEDFYNRRLKNPDSAEAGFEINSIIQTSIETLARGDARNHLRFVSEGDRLRMEIVPDLADIAS
jgi:hypothetical protein